MADTAARYVIIGNGIAGTVAAEYLREHDRACHVSLITKEPYALYNRVKLPYYLKGIIREDEVFMRSPQDERARGIELLTDTKVTTLSTDEKVVETDSGRRLPYDRLLIATGGRPKKLDVPGADAAGVFGYQGLDDVRALRAAISTASSAVVLGGSLIAYEFVDGLREWDIETTWIMRGPHFLHRLIDAQAGATVETIARSHGVTMIFQDNVAELQRTNGAISGVKSTGGKSISCQIFGCAVGLKRNIEFLDGASIVVNDGVLTDEYLTTSDPNVFAAGDVAEFQDVTIGRRSLLGTWHNASWQGEVAAKNMLGQRIMFKATPMYTNPLFGSRIKIIGLTAEDDAEVDSLVHTEPERQHYRRFFFKQDRLIGAVIVGKVHYHLRTALLEYMMTGERVRNKQELMESRASHV